jgi:cytochrome c-type biogenesis protein CcsB
MLFMPAASEVLSNDPLGEPIVSMLALGSNMQREDFNLKVGGVKVIDGISIGFESSTKNDINLKISDGILYLSANDSVKASLMAQTTAEVLAPESLHKISTQHVYSLGTVNFAVKQFLAKGRSQLVYSNPEQGTLTRDAMQARISVGDVSKELVVYGSKGMVGQDFSSEINGLNISLSYGAKIIELPFSLHLKDFELERYPGSNSPSSFASEVILKDGGIEKPFRIFMNNILKYKGYRFFQSSYDTDEMGTILSVNHDSLGTGITYFGYFIMALGMLLGLFNKNSRFKSLLKTSTTIREERKKFFVVLILGVLFAFNANAQTSSLNKKHVKEFGELAIQNRNGRIEPVNTLASQILRKVAKKTSWEGMSPTEIFLDMQANPEKWKNISIIKVSNPELRSQLGIYTGKYTSFNTIVLPREMGGYKLAGLVQKAYEKKSNERNKLDKEIIYVDERVNILMNVFSGNYLTVFPVPNNKNNKWVSATNSNLLTEETANFTQQTITNYLALVSRNDWASANQVLQIIKQNQTTFGAAVIPSSGKIKMEVLYNNINIFGKLSKIFMFTGLILLFIQLTGIFNPKIKFNTIKKVAFIFIFIMFFFETAGLATRWYLSGHAPWSNGYESMIFVSWATCLGGLIFAKRSEITLSLTTLLAGLTLMVAGMSWMSPEITPLVPVLKSYWLIVHVAIITASYGFLGISALLGLLNLILMVFRNPKNLNRINYTIKELVNIIQIALIVGLLMLTVGSFLGGVWANESWGRYWGWDPKETWALVTVLVYTFITHMHRIPGMRGSFAMSAAALVGFSSVLMTYFGVNYYLSGLHSYAQGEAAPIPMGVYIAIVLVFVIIGAALISESKNKQKEDIQTL